MAAPSGALGAPLPPAYLRLIESVLADARGMMERVAESARVALQTRQDQARTPGEHQAMHDARQQLTRLAGPLCERYPAALRSALERETAPREERPARSLLSISFDELELMDESQVNESVERARALQVLASAVDAPLADLHPLVCAALGLARVQPDSNPLRPEVFLQALQTVVTQMQVSAQVRSDWMAQMAHALGGELRALYVAQVRQLQQGGLQPIGYAMRQPNGDFVYVAAPPGDGASPGFAASSDTHAHSAGSDSLLTLGRLRSLLLGDLAEPAVREAGAGAAGTEHSGEPFAERFAREFEAGGADALPMIDPPATDFAMTVPAAFEALQEMNQVGRMIERLGAPRAESAPESAAQRPAAGAQARHRGGLAQALSIEVVTLMVDNIAHDSRLLWPVQQFVQALEPALMQMALADPRFFSNKDHPARRLLQEITERSLAFNSTEAPGFQRFMRALMNIAGPLSTATVEGAHDFDAVLAQLQAKWHEHEQAHRQERVRAIEALQHAEQRHAVAANLSRTLAQRPHIDQVPEEVSQFLLGPWSQVLAEARLRDTTGSPDPGRYHALVDALIWSAQPALTRQNTAQLARMLPELLPRLREGLALIDYPAARTDAIFGLLMQLHQAAFRPAPESAAPVPPAPQEPREATRPTPLADEEPWLAPAEARESGYMDIEGPGDTPTPDTGLPALAESAPAPLAAAAVGTAACPPLHVGNWVNLLAAGQWERTQLSWIGRHGTLFLFTSAAGRTQTMTLRVLNRLHQQGALQILDGPPIVDDALNAVAQRAMRNSVENPT